jgi:putative FmdB family regulatory protein
MPLYEYSCETHGVFDAFRPSSASSEPADCPDCGQSAQRILSIPMTTLLGPVVRNAMERNEKSRHEPHVCKPGCSHHHRSTAPIDTSRPAKRHSYNGPRPWVIEHGMA